MVAARLNEEEIFSAALEKGTPAERFAYLAQVCGEDHQLRDDVERLLELHEEASEFLETTPVDGLGRTAAHDLTERPGAVIGRYRLLERIGQGGFGDVYMAEQTEPVRRKVAVKIIKLGMDTRQVIARFDAERQALALMDHPCIAKVLDAGMLGPVCRTGPDGLVDDEHGSARQADYEQGPARQADYEQGPARQADYEQGPARQADYEQGPARQADYEQGPARQAGPTGRPYFVMELVRGIPITAYCDAHDLTIRERLGLFVHLCHAVQHAHQKGIIHRDIKPTNVLVTVQNGEPVPKVIDFGIAKATRQRLTEKTLFTRHRQLVGTPKYMSPEQVTFYETDVDTRTDIYSLGVLLYELLVGTTPLAAEELRGKGYDEICRVIREHDPPTPSKRLSTLGDSVVDISRHRRVEPTGLRKLLRGDLNWIVMKTLEKDRTRRYETVHGFARDIERHLSDEPVRARPPSVAYRLVKFVRKHRLVVAASSAVPTWGRKETHSR